MRVLDTLKFEYLEMRFKQGADNFNTEISTQKKEQIKEKVKNRNNCQPQGKQKVLCDRKRDPRRVHGSTVNRVIYSHIKNVNTKY